MAAEGDGKGFSVEALSSACGPFYGGVAGSDSNRVTGGAGGSAPAVDGDSGQDAGAARGERRLGLGFNIAKIMVERYGDGIERANDRSLGARKGAVRQRT